jgi:catechol 2,3-dioxygenase-like lactoylglutathione lyase family enzyme
VLGDKDVIATVAVRDLAAASEFYGRTLGLRKVGGEGDEVVEFQAGASRLLVYRSQYAGTNRATAVTWDVGGDVDEIVRALKAKGVAFQRYDLPGAKMEGDVHVFGDLRNAWFEDPDGNIISIVGRR